MCNFLISDIISQENHQVTYRHHLLKTAGKIHSTWFFNNIGNLKSTNNSSVYKLSQTDGIDNLFRVVNLEEFVNSASFLFLLLFVKVLLLFLLQSSELGRKQGSIKLLTYEEFTINFCWPLCCQGRHLINVNIFIQVLLLTVIFKNHSSVIIIFQYRVEFSSVSFLPLVLYSPLGFFF